MSFELGIWKAPQELPLVKAREIYAAAVSGRTTVPPSREIQGFVDGLARLYPALRAIPHRRPAVIHVRPDLPFEIDVREGFVWLGISWRDVGRVALEVEGLAVAHDLVVYAATEDLVFRPGDASPDWERMGIAGVRLVEAALNAWHPNGVEAPDVRAGAHDAGPSDRLVEFSVSGSDEMSFDVAVWKSARHVTVDEAEALYRDLVTSRVELDDSPALSKFANEVRDRVASTLPRGDSRLEFEIDRRPGFVLLSIPWHLADEAGMAAQETAMDLGLTLFDPQHRVLIQGDIQGDGSRQ